MQQAVAEAFKNRPHFVDSAAGFVRMEVISPCNDDSEFWLITWWQDQQSFESWHKSTAHKDSHQWIPDGLKLDPKVTEITYFDQIAD